MGAVSHMKHSNCELENPQPEELNKGDAYKMFWRKFKESLQDEPCNVVKFYRCFLFFSFEGKLWTDVC